MRSIYLALLVVAIASVALADKLVLKDGRSYEGVVLEENDTSVKIKTAKATLTFARDQVASIEKVSGPLQEREEKLAALNPANAEGYLAVATWMTVGKGKEVFDLPTVRRLCAIASKLNPALACDAQMLLGNKLETLGTHREAATCFAMALVAKPGDPDARIRLGEVRGALETDAKKEMEQLAACLDLVVSERYAEALPKLQKAESLATAELAKGFIGMTIEDLTRDIARRVKCTNCDGLGIAECPACKGDGLIECAECGGSGSKKGFTAGKGEDGIASKVCRTCYGIGSLLCVKCKAERTIEIKYLYFMNSTKPDSTVKATAGHEADALKTEIDLIKYVNKTVAVPVAGIRGMPPTAGGRTPCGTCQGIKYAPPSSPPPLDKIRLFMSEVTDRATGQKPYDVIPNVTETWDHTILTDGGVRYKDGKWVK
ncbi:MAG: hypothetical protein K8T20_00875 [Planctomycetes bacterium]|nr:hypothetical protein [Planctomycetota bacterium]